MKTYFVLILFFLSWSEAFGQTFLLKQVTAGKQSLKDYISLLFDSTGHLAIAQVSSPTYASLFKKSKHWETSFELTPQAIFWIKLTIQNTSEETRWRIGSLERYNNMVYYSPDGTDFYIGRSGMNYKPSERFVPYHAIANYSVPVFLTKKKQDIYIRIASLSSKSVWIDKERLRYFLDKFYIIREKEVEKAYLAETHFEFLFFGVCICMMIYNIFIFLFVKDKSYLYYSLSIFGILSYFFYLSGYYVAIVFDVGISRWERDVDDVLSAFGADISVFFFLSFSQVFLFSHQKEAKWYKFLAYLKWYFLIANATFKLGLLWFNTFSYEISTLFHNVHYAFVIVSLIVLCGYLWRNKKRIYLYYIYANLPFFALIIVYILYGHFYIDREKTIFLLDNSFQIGIMLQIISFSIALAARINFMRHEIEQKKLDNEQLNHRLLRSQMNPHFIFNSLGSIQNYLFENDTQKTAKYLANFAKLMRRILENSREDFVLLEKEVQTLETYCMLQQMRFGGSLAYTITVSADLNPEEVQVPPMFAQPFIENAIEHGLLHRPEGGEVQILFSLVGEVVVLEIKDNGIGLAHTQNSPTKPRKEHQSLATRITQERLALLRQKTQLPLVFSLREITSPEGNTLGTQVRIELPYLA